MYKTQLNLYCQKAHIPTPCYKTDRRSDGGFVSSVTFGDSNSYDSLSSHSTKKAAEDEAAGVAVRSLVQRHPSAANIDEVLEQIDSPTNKKKTGGKTQPVSANHQNDSILGNVSNPLNSQFANLSVQVTNASMPGSSSTARMQPLVIASSQLAMHPSQTPVAYIPSAIRPAAANSGISNTLPPSIKPPPGFNASGPPPRAMQPAPTSNLVSSPPPPTSISPQQPTYHPNIPTSMVTAVQIQRTGNDAHKPPICLGPPPLVDTLQQNPFSGVPSSAFPLRIQLGNSPPVNDSRPVATSLSSVRTQLGNSLPVNSSSPALSSVKTQLGNSLPVNSSNPVATSLSSLSSSSAVATSLSSLSSSSAVATSLSSLRIQLNNTPPVNSSRPVATPPLSSLSGSQANPSSAKPSIVSSTSASSRLPSAEWSFHQKLEFFCRFKGLPEPNYHCTEVSGKYSASVVIGAQRFSKPWQYDSFDDAKESAAMMALAYLCFEALSLIQDLRVGTPSRYTSLPTSVPGQIDQPLQNTGPSPTITTHTQLQPPSFFNQKNQQTQSFAQPVVQAVANTQSASIQQSAVVHQPNTFQAPLIPSAPNTDPSKLISIPVQLLSKAASVATVQMEGGDTTYKQALNSYCQKHHLPLSYECEAPDYTVGYIAVIHVGNKVFKSAAQSTKRAAEATVAFEALKSLGVIASQDPHELPGAQMRTPPSSFGSGVSPQHRPVESGAVSYKNLLQEHLQKQGLPTPHYNTERSEEGFLSTVSVHQKAGQSLSFTSALCSVKKGAEQDVAKKACTELHLL